MQFGYISFDTGTLSLETLQRNDQQIPALLQKSLQTRFGTATPTLATDDPWIQRVWHFLTTADSDLSAFIHVPLLPMKKASRNPFTLYTTSEDSLALLPLDGVYVCSAARGVTSLSSSLASALTRLGVAVLHELPDYVTGHRQVLGSFVQYPSTDGVLKAISRVREDPKLIKTFNSNATGEEKAALIQLLSDSRNAHGRLPSVFRRLKLFTVALTKQPASVDEVSYIGPVDLPPVAPPTSLLACSPSERSAAIRLGATEITLQEAVADTLQQMSSGFSQYSSDDVIRFMKYFLQHKTLVTDYSLQIMAREVQFVRTESGQLKRAEEVYDPSSSLLQELFHSRRKTLFPHGEFAQPEMLKRLKKLGLRHEKDVEETDLICTAEKIFEIWSRDQKPLAKKFADSLCKYLTQYGNSITRSTLEAISAIQCLPCLQDGEKPRDYPGSLLLKSSPMIVKPSQLNSYNLLFIVGSVVPVLKPGMTEEVASVLQVAQEAEPQDVLQHLQNVVECFRPKEASQYKFLLKEIFQFLEQHRFYPRVIESLQHEKCVLVDSGDQFASPDSFWIERRQGDIDLKPYRFPMPVEMMAMSDLLKMCGSSESQNDQLLHSVLAEIESKYRDGIPHPDDFRTDFQLVKQILDVLKRSSTARDGNTLLPIDHNQADVLIFKPAKECTVMPASGRSPALNSAGSETYYYVHPDVSSRTAVDFGALLIKDRALTGVEDLDFEYGQHEDLTSRIQGLLEEAYTDGFSVPKELLQNADDARASKVWFLLDERENLSARTNLIADSMADLQGPAIWAYNDAVFSDTDFVNIIKLGGRTKEDDVTKIGKFGLGFNTVYNLTDVPCFFSRSTLAMFDPQRRYLGKGAGLKLDFTKPINRALLGRMPDQFQPFQDVFGCTLRAGTEPSYNGTLFRFPLRTAQQAVNNKLKSDSYSETKRRDFLKMLLERAGNLLMFTQSVREVQVFHLPSHCLDPRNAKCLLTVRKTAEPPVVIQPQVQLGNKTVLQFMKDHWSKKNSDIKIKQKVRIDMNVTQEAEGVCGVKKGNSVTQWQLAWASGVNQSANMANLHRQEGLVPLAAVAISLSENGLQALKDSPPGFYNTGHLFCFLPLPEEMARVTLPVHVNGTFALTSDRRGLMVRTEDDLGSGKSSWNSALYEDAVSRAYLLLLEQVQEEAAADADFSRYFDLWPRTSVPPLVDSFYRRLESDHNRVLPVPGELQWVAFKDARFLQPKFKDTGCGEVAWETLQRFWKGPEHLVDVPSAICKLMAEKGPPKSFEAKVITELAFYRDFVFPNLQDDWWQPEHRDFLIHHALMQNDQKINQLIMANACIPCEGGKLLRRPSELVHPKGRVAKLFLTSEGRFPEAQKSNRIDFCDLKTLQRLSDLGMVTDEMAWDMLLDRAKSVSQLNAEKKTEESLSRASYLIDYLSSTRSTCSKFAFEQCPPEVKESLSHIAFLPVLSKPTDWPSPWEGPGTTSDRLLAPPAEIFSDSLKNLVACRVKLLDSKVLKGTTAFLTGEKREVLKNLGLFVEEDYSHPMLLRLATEQLVAVAEHHNTDSGNNRELSQSISSDVYAFLTRCVKRDEAHDVQQRIRAQLSDKEIVWTGSDFVQPSLVAFKCLYDCSPYLFQLEQNIQRHRDFFLAVGVKDRFEANDVLSALEKVNRDNDGIKLSDDNISLVSRLAQLLGDIAKALLPNASLDTTRVLLPDRHGFMQTSSRLCVDDSPQLRESDRMKFVSDKIPTETARLLGVKTKKRQDFDTLGEPITVEPFGQSEKLTTRIKRLLQGYTFDSSVCKELLQNADDAGATECKFIMDFWHLGTDTVLENWEELQGPALCFYNNKSFTRQDMEGIQNLGIGSKAQDALKIGQFGVGFNAVFHITDVPSFWTREDDEKDVICVLDPNCKYVLNTEPNKPGVKFTDMERLKDVYPDMFSGYLNNAIDMTQSGTLFRFPLRTAHMTKISEIKNESVTESDVEALLDEFSEEMSACLLFLNNLQTVGIYTVNKDGSLKRVFEVNKTVDDISSQHLRDFRASLQQASETMQQSATNLKDIPTFETVVHSKLVDSSGHEDEWLTVHRVGFTEDAILSQKLLDEWRQENFRLLPRGGVAVKLGEKTQEKNTQQRSAKRCQAFCILPLPVHTKLPMHVNGHFALDHETRRNLWESGSREKDVKSEWNSAIALQIIVPTYITALRRAKDVLFPNDGTDLSEALLKHRLQQFHDLFPQPSTVLSEFWEVLAHEVYKTLARHELRIFPVTCVEQPGLEWMPAVTENGFPGYFNNLVAFFEGQEKGSRSSQVVVLSAGITSSSSYRTASEPSPATLAKEMQLLLKNINMKILEVPFRIYHNFIESGVKEVQQVTPETVLRFLRSAGQSVSGGCNIDNLPQPVANTPLRSAHHVQKLVDFVSKEAEFVDSLDGLPLCLRQSETLHKFCSDEHTAKPIISRFSHLLPGSAEEFVHKDILSYFCDFERTHAVLQKLTIPMLASRLRHSLTDPSLNAATPCILEPQKFPYERWLRNLWKFLNAKLEENSTSNRAKQEDTSERLKTKEKPDIKEFRKEAEESLQSLNEWCLIPVKKKEGSQEKSILYPIKYLHRVVYLSCKRDQSNGQLWDILQTLPLPFLDSVELPGLCIANDLVASISHPRALLHALACCDERLTASHKDGFTILTYFSNNLAILEDSSGDKAELRRELRSLPVFPSIDGSLVSTTASIPMICLQSTVPAEGLEQWSHGRRHQVKLLRGDFVPLDLLKYLGFEALTDAAFYTQFLLPSIDALPRLAIVTHMEFLRDNFFKTVYRMEDQSEEWKKLCSQLKSTAFIEVSGTLRRAEDFYSPHNPVFKVMCTDESFPPQHFCAMKWNGLMTAAGIITVVTDEMFLKFASAVEREGSSKITDEVATKSRTLVEHLLTRDKLSQRLLYEVRTKRFLLPLDWRSTQDGKQMVKIAPPFCLTVRLVSYSESSFEHHLQLVWSSSCILDPVSDPRYCCYYNAKQLNVVMQHLGLQEKAPKDRVIQHAKNICQTLGGDRGRDIFASLSNNKRFLIIVMEKLYRYLEDNTKDRDIGALKQLPIICDLDHSQMLKPAKVVIDLRENEAIKGHIEKAPFQFGRYFEFFKKLGSAQFVTASHYATVLSWLKSQSGNEQLNVEELKIVKTAVEGLFRCLREGTDEQKKMTADDLYLPTEDKCLQKSTELIFKDDYLGERFKDPPQGTHFFLGFGKLKIESNLAFEDVKRLPKEHKMVLLSEIVQEIISDEIRDNSEEVDETHPVAAKLSHPMTKQAMLRLVYHQHRRSDKLFNDDTARDVLKKLMDVSVKEISNLKTVLSLHNRPVEGTECRKISFTQKHTEQRKKGKHRTAVVYVATESSRNWSRNEETCVHSLAIAVQFVLQVDVDSYFLHCVLNEPAQAKRLLDTNRIPQCTYGSLLDETVFPSPGEFVPIKHHRHLNNSSYFDFYKGEHVGFEVYDPKIDIDESDETQAAASKIEDNDPVYIYGIVLGEVQQDSAENASRLKRRYYVDLGPERGKPEVKVIKLYKFVRKTRGGTSAITQHQGDTAEETEELPEYRVVLGEIRALLTEAWQLPDKKDRRHVVKRLLLQWHPDKNPGNDSFCTRVTQAILHYVSLLDQGLELPPDDDSDYDNVDVDEVFHRPGSSFYPSFFANMRARGRRHRSYCDAETSSPCKGGSRSRGYRGNSSGPNPQPGEGRRWLRQAQADLTAARAASGTCDRGRNWVCYMCHQVRLFFQQMFCRKLNKNYSHSCNTLQLTSSALSVCCC